MKRIYFCCFCPLETSITIKDACPCACHKDLRSPLEAKLEIAREALRNVTQVSQFNRPGGVIVQSEHYEAAWLDCVDIAKDALSRMERK
jgi:hypothetical protein